MSSCLHFDSRGMSRNTLPLSVWHLHPRVGPALIFIKRLTRCIGPLAFEASGRAGCMAKNGNLHIVVLRTDVFAIVSGVTVTEGRLIGMLLTLMAALVVFLLAKVRHAKRNVNARAYYS
jgi:hypothetical protein